MLIEESLEATLDRLDQLVVEDFHAVEQPAAEAEQAATDLGRPDLVMRARLITTDVRRRRGDVADAGRVARTINAWAYEHRHTYLIARSHHLLSIFYRQVGDVGEALAHALRCVEHTTDEMTTRIRARHYMSLALVLDINGSYEDARERFDTALKIACDDAPMSLAILNNMAYTAYEMNDSATATELVARMRALGVPMDGLQLDTVARVEMMLERWEAVEETLQPVIDDPDGPLNSDGDVLPMCLTTAATALRHRGLLEQAQSKLELARKICDERGLESAGAQVRLEQSELFAARGNYRAAYDEHRRYHAEVEALRSAEREARARALQAMLDADEARRDRERYRQLALHDSLTGLHNRRYVDEYFGSILAMAATRDSPTSVCLVDLDFFKRINDTLSHEVGDDVLRRVAELLRTSVPPPGIAARLGGEEFVLVLPETSAVMARRIAEVARRAVEDFPWSPLTGVLPVTVSVGIATAVGATTQSALLGHADRNLYRAKQNGRNQVVD